MKEAYFYSKTGDGRVICTLCHHACCLKNGERGLCMGRAEKDGMLEACNYGKVISYSVDPIEKKPLYHFRPGSSIASVAQSGCNLECPFCQNYSISQREVPYVFMTPRLLHDRIIEEEYNQTAFTYTEPLMWYEFLYDFASEFPDTDSVIVSNGCINEKPALKIAPLLSAANIDFKSADPDYYRNVLKGDLESVKRTIRILHENSVHLEITHLLVPGANDKKEEFAQIVDFIKGLSKYIPLHISRYFPSYMSKKPPTPSGLIKEFASYAREHLSYVYCGNIELEGFSDTVCPECSNLLIKRSGYHTEITGLNNSSCSRCSRPLDGII